MSAQCWILRPNPQPYLNPDPYESYTLNQVRDSDSFLSKALVSKSLSFVGASNPGARGSGATATQINTAQIPSSDVSALHSKFTQDPNFRGVRGKFGTDQLFSAGIEAIVGPMEVKWIRAMFNEHCLVANAQEVFTAWNAGNVIHTTSTREWLFVVGTLGLDRTSWTFDLALAEPVVDGMMVAGRNSKRLADLMQTSDAQRAGLLIEEVVAVRLYTGMYVGGYA